MGLFGGGAKAIKKRVQRDLSEQASWQVLADGRTWICPFCGEPALKRYPAEDDARLEAVLGHLDGACPGWRDGEGEERHLGELRRTALDRELRAKVKKALVNSASWQLIDVRRQWYCPYCADCTGIEIPGDRRMTESTLQEVIAHVRRCFAFDHGRGEEKPLKKLKKAVKKENRTRKLSERVRRKLEEDPGWRRKGPQSCWVCPYCLKPQARIDLSSNLLMFENAPKQIAVHLLEGCKEYRSGAQPKPLKNTTRSRSNRLQGSAPGGSGTETGPVDPLGMETGSQAFPPAAKKKKSLFDDSDSESLGPRPSDSSPFEASASSIQPPARGSGSLPGWSDTGMTSGFPEDTGLPLPDDDVVLPPWEDEETGSQELRTTLRKLQGSGEFVDEGDERTTRMSSRAIEWRKEIERELASVRKLAPLSGEISLTQQGGNGQANDPRERERRAELAKRGLVLQLMTLPATRPRGDFAEVLDLGNGRLGLAMGGLATEEPDGQLVAAAARTLLTKHAAHDRCPSEVIKAVNQELFPDLDGRNFFTCAYAILDVPTSRLRFCRAGLAPPYVLNRGQSPEPRALGGEGMMMGIDRGQIFASSLEVTSVQLTPGDMLVFFSNGIIEARAVGRSEFGLERMEQLIGRYARHEVEYFCDKFLESFNAFHAPPSRRLVDACVIALKRDAIA